MVKSPMRKLRSDLDKILTRFLDWSMLTISLVYILVLLIIMTVRLVYPYELEWIEGSYVDEAHWVSHGKPLFGQPSINYIPTSKTPLFFYFAAFFMKIFGAGYFAPRLVSVISTVGVLILLFWHITRYSQNKSAGIIAAGIYAASFRFTGAWMDLAKTDSLFIFLILAAFVLEQTSKSRIFLVFSGLIFGLAYMTKQTALPVIVLYAPLSLIMSKGKSLMAWVTFTVFSGISLVGLNLISDGWFMFYTHNNIASHAITKDLFVFPRTFLRNAWPTLILIIIFGLSCIRRTRINKQLWPINDWSHIAFAIALVAASWSVFLKVWTYDNGYMPAILGVATLSALGYSIIDNGDFRNDTSVWVKPFGSLLVLSQFVILIYNPINQLPNYRHYQAWTDLISQIKNLPGEVLVFNHGFVNHISGKTSYIHSSPYSDVISAGEDTKFTNKKRIVLETLSNAITDQEFYWVIIDKENSNWYPYYIYVRDFMEIENDIRPLTGANSTPKSLMVKNPIASGGQLVVSDPNYNSLFLDGWGEIAETGRWINYPRASMNVPLDTGHSYAITISGLPSCENGEPLINNITISWNDASRVTQQQITECEEVRLTYDISSNMLIEDANSLSIVLDTLPFTSSSKESVSIPRNLFELTNLNVSR